MVRIGVCGLSGSGKTTFSALLARQLDSVVIAQDNFYIGNRAMLSSGISGEDFDSLEALDCDQLSSVLKSIKSCADTEVDIPVYDFKRQEPAGKSKIRLKDTVIIEGHLIFTSAEILADVDFLIYIDIDRVTAEKRRFARDINERGYNLENSKSYYDRFVIAGLDIIEQLKLKADYVVSCKGGIEDYNGHVNDIAHILSLDMLSSKNG